MPDRSIPLQGEAVLRLTVVTIFGLIGTIVTGFLGMNLLAEADQPLAVKIADIRPVSKDELRAIYAKERFNLSEEELSGILEIIFRG